MADFCFDCVADLLSVNEPLTRNDLAGLVEPGGVTAQLCEGCGAHLFDEMGRRLCREKWDGQPRWPTCCDVCIGIFEVMQEPLTGATDESIEFVDAEDPEKGVLALLTEQQARLEAGYEEVEPEVGS